MEIVKPKEEYTVNDFNELWRANLTEKQFGDALKKYPNLRKNYYAQQQVAKEYGYKLKLI